MRTVYRIVKHGEDHGWGTRTRVQRQLATFSKQGRNLAHYRIEVGNYEPETEKEPANWRPFSNAQTFLAS